MSSARLGLAIAEALVAAGIAEVVVCPGSRSTAIAVGLAALADRGRLRLHTRTDERVAGFLALGLARTRGAAAVVVTSGTALGNLVPAVMEAKLAGVPLVVVTADRPATLVGSGSNQTTEQIGLFGRHVVADLYLASSDDDPVRWLAGLGRVLIAARGLRTRNPGPVHVNVALSEPFLGESELPTAVKPLRVSASRPAEPVTLPAGARTVVLAGDAPPAVGRQARAVAEQAGLPLFAEPSSNARAGRCALAHYRNLLDTELGARIERVLIFGHPTLSRPVARLLARDDVELVAVSDRANWPDPGGHVQQVHDAVTLAQVDDGWLDDWLAADARQSAEAGPAGLIQAGQLTGPWLAAEAVASATGNLVFGCSNPIRDADLAPIRDDPPSCWANRGLAGVDGVISTASGIMLGSGEPTTVLLGDLTFLHDLGGLHVPAGQTVPDLRVVIADDDGGSIFRTLEVADNRWFERLFAMPHGRDLGSLASGFGWPTRTIDDADEVRAQLARPIDGIEVLVVRVDPSRP